MKRLSIVLLMAAFAAGAWSQNQVTLRQQNFPTALPMVEDNVEWQRDVYRELDLHDDRNAGLYCPVEPSKIQQGLFMKVFQLAVSRIIPIYRYNIDGNEVFNDATRADIKDILVNHQIFFQEENGQIIVDKDDIPASEVLTYYLKEGVYFDLTNNSYRIRVLALCPVIIAEDEFSDEPVRYPLFWVEYKDIEPHVKDIPIIPDYRNGMLRMTMADYFTLNKYHGEIYKVANAFGYTLRQKFDNDSTLKKEQERIENELKAVRKPTYNTYYKPANPTKQLPERKPRRRWPWQKKNVATEPEKDSQNN